MKTGRLLWAAICEQFGSAITRDYKNPVNFMWWIEQTHKTLRRFTIYNGSSPWFMGEQYNNDFERQVIEISLSKIWILIQKYPLFFFRLLFFHSDENGAVSNVKFYDYQLYFYQSLVFDLIFFLFTSVRTEDLNEYLVKLINSYCDYFLKTLQTIKCPMEDYTMDKYVFLI